MKPKRELADVLKRDNSFSATFGACAVAIEAVYIVGKLCKETISLYKRKEGAEPFHENDPDDEYLDSLLFLRARASQALLSLEFILNAMKPVFEREDAYFVSEYESWGKFLVEERELLANEEEGDEE
jgi:hypothetical protein